MNSESNALLLAAVLSMTMFVCSCVSREAQECNETKIAIESAPDKKTVVKVRVKVSAAEKTASRERNPEVKNLPDKLPARTGKAEDSKKFL